jgi:integrase/recombinase XerD
MVQIVERNRLCFVLSLYSGLRVGEIAALTIGDVATQNGDVRREIKLGVHQTKGSKSRTVILSERVRKEIASFFKNKQPYRDQGSPLIASQRNGRAFSNVTLSMLFKEVYETAGIRTSSHSAKDVRAARMLVEELRSSARSPAETITARVRVKRK